MEWNFKVNMDNSGSLNGWTKQETLKLIEEYKKHSILYKPNHADHLKPNKKREAIMAIVDSLRCLKPNVTENSVKTKLKTLRHQLASEKKKFKSNDASDSTQCKPTLWCYEELSFLLQANDEPYHLGFSRSNNSRIFNEEQFEEQSTEDSEHFIRPETLRNDSELDTFQMTINKSMDIIDKITSPKVLSKEEAFCQYLSTELRGFKFEESFDEFKMSAMILLQNIKAKEKKAHSENNFAWQDGDCSSPGASTKAPSMPVPIKCSSGAIRYSRKRTSSPSADSILGETISNDYGDGVCDVGYPGSNFKCEPEVDL